METFAITWPVLLTSAALIVVLAENALSVAGLGLFRMGEDDEG